MPKILKTQRTIFFALAVILLSAATFLLIFNPLKAQPRAGANACMYFGSCLESGIPPTGQLSGKYCASSGEKISDLDCACNNAPSCARQGYRCGGTSPHGIPWGRLITDDSCSSFVCVVSQCTACNQRCNSSGTASAYDATCSSLCTLSYVNNQMTTAQDAYFWVKNDGKFGPDENNYIYLDPTVSNTSQNSLYVASDSTQGSFIKLETVSGGVNTQQFLLTKTGMMILSSDTAHLYALPGGGGACSSCTIEGKSLPGTAYGKVGIQGVASSDNHIAIRGYAGSLTGAKAGDFVGDVNILGMTTAGISVSSSGYLTAQDLTSASQNIIYGAADTANSVANSGLLKLETCTEGNPGSCSEKFKIDKDGKVVIKSLDQVNPYPIPSEMGSIGLIVQNPGGVIARTGIYGHGAQFGLYGTSNGSPGAWAIKGVAGGSGGGIYAEAGATGNVFQGYSPPSSNGDLLNLSNGSAVFRVDNSGNLFSNQGSFLVSGTAYESHLEIGNTSAVHTNISENKIWATDNGALNTLYIQMAETPDASGGLTQIQGNLIVRGDISDNNSDVIINDGLSVSSNLTVDTDTLIVDSANNRVGIGISNPTEKLHVNGGNILVNGGNITTTGNVNMGWEKRSNTVSGRTASIDCSTGKKVMGGGVFCSTTSGSTYVERSYPSNDDTWSGLCSVNANAQISVYIICARIGN